MVCSHGWSAVRPQADEAEPGGIDGRESPPPGRGGGNSQAQPSSAPAGAGSVARTMTTGGVSRYPGRLHPWLHSIPPPGIKTVPTESLTGPRAGARGS